MVLEVESVRNSEVTLSSVVVDAQALTVKSKSISNTSFSSCLCRCRAIGMFNDCVSKNVVISVPNIMVGTDRSDKLFCLALAS